MLPIIYIDLDGVIADFYTKIAEYRGSDEWCDVAFKNSVVHYKIFNKLDMLPNASKLIKAIKSLSMVQKEFLTSTGCMGDMWHHEEAKLQKTYWLQKHNLHYKVNFVKSGEEKGLLYASPDVLLIDDTPEVVNNFINCGGNAILHKDSEVDKTIEEMYAIVSEMKSAYIEDEFA